MVDLVQKRVRERPVEAELRDIVELLNREHTPLLIEARTRLNELINALNPAEVVAAAGAGPSAYLEVTIQGTDYAIPLYPRA